MGTLASINGIFQKDIISEIRNRYGISAIILFIVCTISIVIFSFSGDKFNDSISAALIWIIMFFGSMTGLQKSFVGEEERGTSLLLKLNGLPSSVYFGKLFYNILLSLATNSISVLLFFILTDAPVLKYPGIYLICHFLGCLGLAAATTIISAIISRANTKGALFPVLSLPVLLPLIMLGVDCTLISFSGRKYDNASSDLIMMLCYSGIMIPVSFIIFDFVWKD